MDIEENLVSSFARKRLCIKTKQADNILEKFKVIFKGKVYMARAKKLFAWTLIFLDHKESEYISDDESLHGAKNKSVGSQHGEDDLVDDLVDDNDVEGVSETFLVMNNSQEVHENVTSNGESAFNYAHNAHNGGSILEVLDDMIRVGQSMGYAMEGCLGHKTKKEWAKELKIKHNVNFLALQETKMDRVNHMDVKFIWGNSNYQYVSSDSTGSSGGILCVWEATIFKKDYATVSDNFIVIYETWIFNNSKVLIVVIYAPPSLSHKRVLWDYISSLIALQLETLQPFYHVVGACGCQVGRILFYVGSSFATKMSKLDRFLVSEDYGPIPFRFYHSWFKWDGFDVMVEQAWNSFSHSDTNGLIRFKKKLQDLKKIIHKNLDSGNVSDEILLKRMELTRQLHDINQMEARDYKRSQISIHGVFVDGDWNTDPDVVKDVFKDHFATRFKQHAHGRLKLNISFPNRLSIDQVADMDRSVSRDEIRVAVWNCGENKSLGPDDGSFPKGSNSSFIALIPKVTDAKFVIDFRPINLIGCVYKVVTKILANRLATVISDLVSDIQSAFVANRQLLDGPFILNELLAWCKRKKKQAMIFKVDFAKAYDSVRRDYLLDVLQAFGFGPNWCKWIRGTFREWSDSNLDNIVKILKCFFLASGLKINIQKSQVLGVGVPSNIVNKAASLIGCAVMQNPFRYLGVMVGDSMSRKLAWADMVKKSRSRLSKWKVKTLSIGDWNAWYSAIRLSSRIKLILEGVFYVAWWHLWVYRNQSIFAATPPKRSVIFDDIVSRFFT
nr:hypothetical protein [Tanacetum cinerariifolium]